MIVILNNIEKRKLRRRYISNKRKNPKPNNRKFSLYLIHTQEEWLPSTRRVSSIISPLQRYMEIHCDGFLKSLKRGTSKNNEGTRDIKRRSVFRCFVKVWFQDHRKVSDFYKKKDHHRKRKWSQEVKKKVTKWFY